MCRAAIAFVAAARLYIPSHPSTAATGGGSAIIAAATAFSSVPRIIAHVHPPRRTSHHRSSSSTSALLMTSSSSPSEPPSSSSSPTPSTRYLLSYDYVPDVLERRGPYREGHLGLANMMIEGGTCVSGGPTLIPGEGVPKGGEYPPNEKEERRREERFFTCCRWVLLYEFENFISVRPLPPLLPSYIATKSHDERFFRLFIDGPILFTALFVFTTKDAAEKFVSEDPYVSNGIVVSHAITEWTVVVGNN
ncbi:hypothetical protein ACHAXA_007779 [Cyclostephanos tholiformis]|uniref:YCII-related domain-containing protein n=1 Tax=Cyclostephanos tholiformis TaxID=382380 RepID=A0ABD3R956_9STRA